MKENSNEPDNKEGAEERPLFPHPPWMVGIVLIFAVLSILAGFSDPIWFLLGLPCILVLALFIYVKITKRKSPALNSYMGSGIVPERAVN
jgi:hypothetical protein